MEFDIAMPSEEDKFRQAYRTRVPGLDVRFMTKTGVIECQVRDISAGGFAFADEPRSYSNGQELVVDILLAKKLFLGDIKAKVMRVLDNGVIGCNFKEMDRRQEIKLDKLVLEVQKRLIELRKAKQEE